MRIKNLPSIESMDGSQDALVIEQTDGSEDKSRKVSPAQIKQFIEAGDFEATGEVKDGHGNILKAMAKSVIIGDLSQTGLTGDSVAAQLGTAKGQIANVASGISVIAKKIFTANNENDFLAQVFADIKADSQAYATGEYYASIHRVYGWLGTNTYIVDAIRPSGRWIESIVYAFDRLYIIEYDCNNNVIGTKKTATLT